MNASAAQSNTTSAKSQAEDATLVIFGASGDLTARKLIPAVYTLWREGYVSDRVPIVGVARRDKSDESFRNELFEALRDAGDAQPGEEWDRFARRLFYRKLDLQNADDFTRLRTQLEVIEEDCGVPGNRVVYLATDPSLFIPSVEGLAQAGLIPEENPERNHPWLRVVFEKPFGHDLDSARELSQTLGRLLSEEQIYRIDHYLGKETVQNILLFRFGNSVFEPLLNRGHVDHVQITVAESQGIERGRGGYYDQSGALRDVLQNHLLQLLCLVAMEPPSMFRAKDIRDEKLKVLEALEPGDASGISKWAVMGQYAAGEVNGASVVGYREEDRVPPESHRETYVGMEAFVENWRWAGVPFFLRTGKRLPTRVTEIAVQFKLPPLHLFTTVECEGDLCDLVGARPNTLVFRIQPDEAIFLTFSTKRPGMQYQIEPVTMNFLYEQSFDRHLPEAYERLLLDVLRGDSTLFTRSDELEAAWRFVTPVLEAVESGTLRPETYSAGTWGPKEADKLLTKTGRVWRTPMVKNKQR